MSVSKKEGKAPAGALPWYPRLRNTRGDLAQTLAEQTRRCQVAGRDFVDRRVRRRGGSKAGKRGQVVDVVARGRLAIARHHARAGPQHAVLLRQREQGVERRLLVAGDRGRV